MSAPATVTGRELYALLPTVYRVKDDDGDLARYLDACGMLLDRMRATLEQRLADAFPRSEAATIPSADIPASHADTMAAQSWLLPYFADLLDVSLVSPHVDGRRAEVDRAIAWRQRKGTLATIEEIAEDVGGVEVEVQEGWRRVAVTPRPDRPLLPAAAFGVVPEPDPHNPLVARRHPALPAVTVDVTQLSRAIECDPSHPRAKSSHFRGVSVSWRQLNPQGVPCFPGSFEDAARRTPDVRTPGPSRGHIHPRRLLLFVPPSIGFFPFDAIEVQWSQRETQITDQAGDPRKLDPFRGPDDLPLKHVFITTQPPALTDNRVEINDLVFNPGLRFTGTHLKLHRVAMKKLVVNTTDVLSPVIDAVDCLFDEIEAPTGLVRLEGTTVMKTLNCRRLQASDCLFGRSIDLHPAINDPRSCVRFSRIPPGFAAPLGRRLERASLTTVDPIFFSFEHCAREGGSRKNENFGDPGYGVLHPSTPDAIRFGAEDGGEMGADHHRATCLAHAAILTKLEEFLPLGIEAVLIPDPRLLATPPRIKP